MTATSSPRAIRKPKGEGHERRAEILAAAERIFVEHGYEGATIRKIADEVGLSSTALYMHFAEKGEILHEICRGAFEALMAANGEILAAGGDVREVLERMLRAYVDFGFSNPNAYRLAYMTRPVELRDGAQSAARELGHELFRAFEQVVARAQDESRLKRPARETAQVLWSGVHGLVSLMITKPYFDWAEREALTDAMIEALFDGAFHAG